jgi:hypothetical protein
MGARVFGNAWLAFLFLLLFPRVGDADGDVAADLKALFPDGASVDSRLETESYDVYERDALFDYINGGAEVYLDLGFIRVGAREYVADLEEKTYFTLDVYDMSEPIRALSIYSSEAYGDPEPVSFGAGGYLGGGSLAFWSRRFYVKVRADDVGDEVDGILRKIAKDVADRIGEPANPIPEFALFPTDDRIPGSERYVPRDFFGISGLSGYSCAYSHEGQRRDFGLVLVETDERAHEVERALEKKYGEKTLPTVLAGRYFGFARKLPGKGDFAPTKKEEDWAPKRVGEYFGRILEAAKKEAETEGERQGGDGG